MREILFRAKVKYNGNHLFAGEWVYGSLINKSTGAFIYVKEEDEFGNIVREFEVEVIHETVGEYTDIHDKNGAMVFEGDVVKFIYNCEDRIEPIVCFSGGFSLGYCIDLIRSQIDQYKEVRESIEVTGTIHDNKDLLS